MAIDKNFYNESSAAKLGWDPTWFGEKYFDDKLVRAVKKWQKENGLAADGLCGPATFRRLWTERQADIDDHKPASCHYSNYIVYQGNFTPIEWDKVVLWSEQGGLETPSGNYYSYSGRPKRNIRLFVNHWDVCLSSRSCQRVLDKRGASVHFLIDNDGTIYQTLDIQHGAWHAGSERVNRASVGVEISNAYYTKYQSWYEKNGFGLRPLVDDAWVHGNKLREHTDFYPVQIEALKALWKAIHKAAEIPYDAPKNQFGTTSTKYEQGVKYGNFSGFISHYHVSKGKIDCAGLDILKLLEEVKDD
jgi:peptidoglycan hydrolase-like protein with peptidoglycan-binding domain